MLHASRRVLLLLLCLLSALVPAQILAQNPAPKQPGVSSAPATTALKQTVSIPQTAPAPPASQGGILSFISFCLFAFPPIVYAIAYVILYKHIAGCYVSTEIVNVLLESSAFFVIGGCLYRFLNPTLLVGASFFLGSTLYCMIRLHERLQPARDQRAADELKRAADELNTKRETLSALAQ